MLSISNQLIALCLIFTTASFFSPELHIYGLNHIFILEWNYFSVGLQILLYSFLHGGIFHLLFNSIFLGVFWNQLERYIGKFWYILFFLFSTIFTGMALFIFTPIGTNTIGISWFALWILTFLTALFFQQKNDEYKWGLSAIFINIALWFTGNISLIWHIFGALSWGIFYLMYRIFQKK